MRATKWWLGASAIALFTGGSMAACGGSQQSSGGAGDSGGDSTSSQDAASQDAASQGAASSDATQDVMTTDDAADAGVDDACLLTDADIATIDAGRGWGCFQSMCADRLSLCAADCTCNDAMLLALLCVARGGMSTPCFTQELTENIGDRNVVLVGNCLVSNQSLCLGAGTGAEGGIEDSGDGGQAEVGATSDGAPDAGPDAGAEAGMDGGGDAAAPQDAADAG